MSEFFKSVGAKLGAIVFVAAAWVQGLTCEGLAKIQSYIPEDVTDWSLWVTAVIGALLSGYTVKRSVDTHKLKA